MQNGHGQVTRALAQTVLDTLRESGLPDAGALADGLKETGTTIGIDRLEHLLDVCRERFGPACGLAMGARARPATFSALGYLAMSSRTLGEAVRLMPSYESVVMDTGRTLFVPDGGNIRLGWLLNERQAHPVLEDFILAAWLSLGRWLVGRDFHPIEVCLSHAASPGDPAAYRQYFQCPVRFGCAHAEVRFPAAWLDLPVVHADPELHAMMLERARALQVAQSSAGRWGRRVMEALPDLLPRQEATLTAVAARLDLSERSLRRRLAEEGQPFGDLLLAQRKQLAQHYLRDDRLGLLDIALLLGYAEHSAFSAAFRHWFGVPPQQFRQALAGEKRGVAALATVSNQAS